MRDFSGGAIAIKLKRAAGSRKRGMAVLASLIDIHWRQKTSPLTFDRSERLNRRLVTSH
jgi:hypothetical protein